MDKIGSKPSSDMGGSVRGDAHKRIRPKRRGSINANSTSDSFSPCLLKCNINCSVLSTRVTTEVGHTNLYEAWRPTFVVHSGARSIANSFLSFDLDCFSI